MLASAVRLHLLKADFRQEVGHGTIREIKAIRQRRKETAEKLPQGITALLKLAAGAAE